MSVLAIWNAVRAGDAEALRAALHARVENFPLGRRADNHGWTLLHHAAVSSSLECVQLIATRLSPDCEKRCHEGYTALARACRRSAPLSVVSYLIERRKSSINIGNNEDVTPLHYAVARNRLDLVSILVENGANVNALDYADESPSDTAAFDTGNVRILIYLLFSAKSRCPDITVFSARATYGVAEKIAIFKLLYNFQNSHHMHRQRYDVKDILQPALLSNRSQSLIPFFVETEMKWEKNETIRSLYKLLASPDYGVLAMLVWVEAKHSQTLDGWMAPTDFSHCGTAVALTKLAQAAVLNDEQLELMANLISSLKVTKPIVGQILPAFFQQFIVLMRNSYCSKLTLRPNWDWKISLRYQRLVDILMPCYENNIDEFLVDLLESIKCQGLLKFVLPLIGHCSYIFMSPEEIHELRCKDWMEILCRSIGTMQTQKVLFCMFPCFALKRLTRDAVRMAVYNGMKNSNIPRLDDKFIQRLESLELPNELKLYLKYRDSETMNDLSAACVTVDPAEYTHEY